MRSAIRFLAAAACVLLLPLPLFAHHGSFYKAVFRAIEKTDVDRIKDLFSESARKGKEGAMSAAELQKLLKNTELIQIHRSDASRLFEYSSSDKKRSKCLVSFGLRYRDEPRRKVQVFLLARRVDFGDTTNRNHKAWQIVRIVTKFKEAESFLGRKLPVKGLIAPDEKRPSNAKPIARRGTNAWSKPDNGLSGRLRVVFEDIKPGLRHAVTLELKNVSLKPLAVINQPRIEAELFNSAGKRVNTTARFSMSGPIPDAQWGVIPRDANLGFRIDMLTVGVPSKDQALLAVGGKTWGLKPGKYTRESKMICKKQKGPNNQWVGQIVLPPVEIIVTNKQVAQK